MRTLVIDIETSPNVADVWGLWQQNVSLNQLHESSKTICFAAKWTDSKKVPFHSVYADGYENMTSAMWDLLDEADAVVGWNSVSFDEKTMNNEFLRLKLGPPSPFKSIDLMRAVKRNFRLPSNKLDYVANELGHGNKLSTGGHGLWRKCLEWDPAAWKLMEKYNKQDVRLTEALYFDLLPWISNHPNVGLYNGVNNLLDVCPNCGSSQLQKRGFYTAQTTTYQKFSCTNCGRWSRSTKRVESVQIRGI